MSDNSGKLNLGKTTEAETEKTALPEGTVQYTSHPIDNYRLGHYRFKKGLLTLAADEAGAFDDLLAKQPALERTRVRKLDVKAAEEYVRKLLENASGAGATKSFDSSIGERAEKVVGTGVLGDKPTGDSK